MFIRPPFFFSCLHIHTPLRPVSFPDPLPASLPPCPSVSYRRGRGRHQLPIQRLPAPESLAANLLLQIALFGGTWGEDEVGKEGRRKAEREGRKEGGSDGGSHGIGRRARWRHVESCDAATTSDDEVLR